MSNFSGPKSHFISLSRPCLHQQLWCSASIQSILCAPFQSGFALRPSLFILASVLNDLFTDIASSLNISLILSRYPNLHTLLDFQHLQVLPPPTKSRLRTIRLPLFPFLVLKFPSSIALVPRLQVPVSISTVSCVQLPAFNSPSPTFKFPSPCTSRPVPTISNRKYPATLHLARSISLNQPHANELLVGMTLGSAPSWLAYSCINISSPSYGIFFSFSFFFSSPSQGI